MSPSQNSLTALVEGDLEWLRALVERQRPGNGHCGESSSDRMDRDRRDDRIDRILQALASISSLEEGVTSGDGGWSQVKRWFGEDVSALSVPGRTEEGQRIIVRFRDGRHITVFAETADRAWAKLRAVAFVGAPATQAEREALKGVLNAHLFCGQPGITSADTVCGIDAATDAILSLLESRHAG